MGALPLALTSMKKKAVVSYQLVGNQLASGEPEIKLNGKKLAIVGSMSNTTESSQIIRKHRRFDSLEVRLQVKKGNKDLAHWKLNCDLRRKSCCEYRCKGAAKC